MHRTTHQRFLLIALCAFIVGAITCAVSSRHPQLGLEQPGVAIVLGGMAALLSFVFYQPSR